MMKDLQTGFSSAMSELSKIQHEDATLHERLNATKEEHSGQIKELLTLVQQLKVNTDS